MPESIPGRMSAEALQAADRVVRAFLDTLASGTQDPTRMQELHAALLTLNVPARSARYGEVLRALESVHPVPMQQVDVARAVEATLSSHGAAHLEQAVRFADAGSAPGCAILDLCRQTDMQASTLAIIQQARLGIKDGPLFEGLTNAYTSVQQDHSYPALLKRLQLLEVAAAIYDKSDPNRNLVWAHGTLFGCGGVTMMQERPSAHPSVAVAALARQIHAGRVSPLPSHSIEQFCRAADELWGAQGITFCCQRRAD